MKQEIIIVPLAGLTVKVSEDSITVAIDGADRVQGYTLAGGEWMYESEDAYVAGEWMWDSYIRCQMETLNATEEEVYALCYFLNSKKTPEFAVLMPRDEKRYYFLTLSRAKVSYSQNFPHIPSEIVFTGESPYSITCFDGEVEVAGRAVEWADECITAGLQMVFEKKEDGV